MGRLHAQTVFLDLGDNWNFFRGTVAPSEPPTAWRDPGFDDGAWESGATPIGYDSGADSVVTLATELDDMEDNYVSVYGRTTFEITQTQIDNLTSLILSIDYDDGFIAYVNGVEVARAQMGASPDEFTFEDTSTAGHEADGAEYFDITATAVPILGPGENLIAIEVHNTTIGSSDLSFDVRLSSDDPRVDCPTGLNCESTLTSVILTWTNSTIAVYDEIRVSRNGTPIPGSPFDGALETVQDTAPGNFLNVYEVSAVVSGEVCAPIRCYSVNDFTLLEDDEDWRFFRGTEAPPATWRDVGFDDSGWEIGPTGIGYGDGDDNTELTDMPMLDDDPDTIDVDESQPGYASFYARKAIDVANPAAIANLLLEIDFDDGFIAYLNGTEVARSDSLADAGVEVPFDALALLQHEADGFEGFDITAALPLNVGENVLAVQVHNAALDSSDSSFIPRMSANECFTGGGLSCDYDETSDEVTITFDPIGSDSVAITRNGVAIAGSPFPGGSNTFVDGSPTDRDNVYEISVTVGGRPCPVQTCTIDCGDRLPEDALTCELSLVNGDTQAELNWTTPAGTDSILIEREGELIDTIGAGASSYVDPNVESTEPENDTEYSVIFEFAGDDTCTISCPPVSLCPENFLCTINASGEVELSWDNIVKDWTGITIQRDGADLTTLAGNATSFTDDTIGLFPGEVHTYELVPAAPVGEEVGCTRSCTVAAQVPEVASYNAPEGDWDYQIDFGSTTEDAYTNDTEVLGNLDGNWIRAAIDSWDGSAPEDFGAAPDGAAPGGIEVESVADGAPCGESTNVLRILDPGNTSAPAGSLEEEFPDAFTAPNNDRLFLGFDTGVSDRNLLRDGVTFAARWRVRPVSPEYLNASNTGDGSPIDGGRGHVGIYFVDDGSLGTAGDTAALSFSLNTGDQLQMSTAPTTVQAGIDVDEFKAVWVTIEDPEGDDTYNINVYLNGETSPSTFFGTGNDQSLQSPTLVVDDNGVDVPYFGSPVGNFLAIGQHNAGSDGDIQIDYVAFKAGVHPPTSTFCDGAGTPFRRGDINDDAILNLTDGINLLNFLFLGGTDTTCKETQDTNNDGTVNLTDGIGLFNFLFLGGGSPAPPSSGNCGFDPPGNALGCGSYTSC